MVPSRAVVPARIGHATRAAEHAARACAARARGATATGHSTRGRRSARAAAGPAGATVIPRTARVAIATSSASANWGVSDRTAGIGTAGIRAAGILGAANIVCAAAVRRRVPTCLSQRAIRAANPKIRGSAVRPDDRAIATTISKRCTGAIAEIVGATFVARWTALAAGQSSVLWVRVEAAACRQRDCKESDNDQPAAHQNVPWAESPAIPDPTIGVTPVAAWPAAEEGHPRR